MKSVFRQIQFFPLKFFFFYFNVSKFLKKNHLVFYYLSVCSTVPLVTWALTCIYTYQHVFTRRNVDRMCNTSYHLTCRSGSEIALYFWVNNEFRSFFFLTRPTSWGPLWHVSVDWGMTGVIHSWSHALVTSDKNFPSLTAGFQPDNIQFNTRPWRRKKTANADEYVMPRFPHCSSLGSCVSNLKHSWVISMHKYIHIPPTSQNGIVLTHTACILFIPACVCV